MSSGRNIDGNQLQHVNAWSDRFDTEIYAPISGIQSGSIGQDFIGWTSMYDGADIDKTEMKEWLDETIHTIHTKVRWQLGNVLEVGSGSGMILFNLGNSLIHYTGFEPSGAAVDFIIGTTRSTVPRLANKVDMYKATAADVRQMGPAFQADLVILNSVVQYFPSQEYLFHVIRDLVQVNGVKTVFLGDIRSYPLHKEFLAARALFMAGEKASREDLRRMIWDMEQIERELLVDPGFFTSLMRRLPDLIQHVEIQPKKMKATNELSSYRYTVVLYSRSWIPPCGELRTIPGSEWVDFQKQNLDRGWLQQRIKTLSSSPLAISNIPNTKTIFAKCLLSSLGDEKARKPVHMDWTTLINQEAKHIPSLSTIELCEMAKEASCRVQISWNRQYSQQGGFDAIFYRHPINGDRSKEGPMFSLPTDHTERPQQTFSNKPTRQQLIQEVQQQLDEIVKLQLPSYMVPQSIQVLQNFPINQNGKVDRKALLKRTTVHAATGQKALQRELSTAELKLQQILAQVLGIDASRIGPDDSFFQLGGDSITAMKIVAPAREEDIQLTVANIFQHPKLVDLATVAQFAQHTADAKSTQPFSFLSLAQKDHLLLGIPANTSDVGSKDIVDILPTTWMQNLFISRGVNEQPLAFNYFFLDLGTRVDAPRLRRSVRALVQHFSILRTKFVYVDGILWQAVLRNREVPFTEVQLHMPLDEAADTVCLEDSRTTDALELPTAFMLVRGASNEHRLFIRISHAQYDGVSFPSFIRTLFAFYHGKPVEPVHSYSTYLAYVQGRKSASALYWRTLLQGSHITKATPLLGPQIRHGLTSIEVWAEGIINMPRVPTGLTLASLVSAAWAKVLSQITGEEDVVYGSMIAGRNANIPTIAKIVGPCLNIIPVRAKVHPTTTSTELVRPIQEQYIALGEADSMGFDEIVRSSTDWPADTHYDSVFQHQNLNEHPEFDFEDTTARLHWFQNPDSAPAILTVVSYPLENGLRILVRGNERIITPEGADMIRKNMCEMIEKLASSL